MSVQDEEDKKLRAAALKNVEGILAVRKRAEREGVMAKEALEKKSEELEQQRAWFEVTLSSIGDAVITTDLQGNVTFMNPVAEALTGWAAAEAKGRPLAQVFHIINEKTRQAVESPVDDVLQSGRSVALANHTSLVRRDGTVVAIEDSAAPIRDADGEVAGAVMVFHDVTPRRRAEEALREGAQRLQLAMAAGDLGDWAFDAKTGRTSLSPRAAEILGMPGPGPFPREEVRARLLPEEQEASRVAAEYALAHRSVYNCEYRVVRPDGGIIWVAARGLGVYDENGGVTGMIGVIQEITERKRTEEAQARLAAVVESSSDAILSKTLEGIITTWNAGAERMFGYRPEEMIGQSVTKLIPADHPDEEPAILERLRRGERIEHYETVRVRKDGTLVEVSLSVSPVRDSNGVIIGASKIARDISEQKRQLGALRDETRVLELLNATGPAIASQLNLQSLVQTATDAGTELSGAAFGAFFYNVTNAAGESYLLFALSGAPREAFEGFGLPRNTPVFNPTFRGEGVVRSADITQDPRYGKMGPHHGMPKGHLPVRSYLAVPVTSRSGAAIGGLFFGHPEPGVFTERAERLVVGLAAQAAVAIDNARLYEAAQQEIAKREKAEAALRETDRRKDEFLATLAHELRNPLAPIRQAALISKAEGATDSQKRWSHDVISRQVHHMALLLDDLLDISRITRGTLGLRPEMTSVSAVVEAALETARPAIDAKRHTLEVVLPEEPVRLAADPLRLAQVLSNLLTNAAKYTDPEGRIRLRAFRENDTLVISVADNGVGIEPESLKDVFVMFSQVKSGHDRSEGGLGIGLALAKGLVELHGGTIEARSEGKGSEFIVRLPIHTLELSPRKGTAAARASGATSRRILVADDNRDAAESLAMLLQLEGHEVTIVHDGREALAAFDVLRPEVAFLDIGMPELNGYEVARIVRQRPIGRAVTLIALTGWGQDADKTQALAAGFNHHFTKPVEPDRLIEVLRNTPAEGTRRP
jgi:PAS domain S-box-containing protein